MDNINCSCIKGKFDFTLCYTDCDKLVLCDLSDWMEEDYYSLPSTFPAEITHPLGNTTTIELLPKQCKVITSTEFLGSECTIPDGVYCITVDNCGTIYTKTFSILCNLRNKLDALYLEEGNDKEKDNLERYLKYIEVNAKFDKKDEAKGYFDIASKILDRLDCKN